MSEPEIEPCPSCGALPCDWVNDPHRNATRPADDQVEAVNALPGLLDEVEGLRAALRPFADAGGIKLCGGDYWTDEKSVQGTDVAFHIKFGDLRAARAALGGRE